MKFNINYFLFLFVFLSNINSKPNDSFDQLVDEYILVTNILDNYIENLNVSIDQMVEMLEDYFDQNKAIKSVFMKNIVLFKFTMKEKLKKIFIEYFKNNFNYSEMKSIVDFVKSEVGKKYSLKINEILSELNIEIENSLMEFMQKNSGIESLIK